MTITPFHVDCAADVVRWPTGQNEVLAWAGSGTSFPLTSARLLAWHDDPDVHPFVGYQDEGLVSYGELWVDESDSEVELARIIVHPAQRGRGIGRTFVGLLVARAAMFGALSTTVRVLPENAPAISCYRAAGFVEASTDEQEAFNRQQPREYCWMRYLEPGTDRNRN